MPQHGIRKPALTLALSPGEREQRWTAANTPNINLHFAALWFLEAMASRTS